MDNNTDFIKYLNIIGYDDNLNSEDFAYKLYNRYIEEDDELIIKSMKRLYNSYNYYNKFKLRSYLYKWFKISKLYNKLENKINTKNEYKTANNKSYINNSNKFNINNNLNTNTSSIKINMEGKLPNNNNLSDINNYLEEDMPHHYDPAFNGLNFEQRETNYNLAKKKNNIFERLYIDSFKRADNYEYYKSIKEIKEKERDYR